MIEAALGGLLQRLAANRTIFDWTRHAAYAGIVDRVAGALALRDGERLLDLGCGTGFAARLQRGMYLGIDQEWEGLRLAYRRRANAACTFAAMGANRLALRTGAFDKAVCIHMVHHLETPVLDAMLAELARVVRGTVVVVDAAPDIANAVERFFLRHDRGGFFRSRADLRQILERQYAVAREVVFHNSIRTAPMAMFTLAPRRV